MLGETPGAHNPQSLKVIWLLVINLLTSFFVTRLATCPWGPAQPPHSSPLLICPQNVVCLQEQSVLHKLLQFRLYFVIVQHLNFNSQQCIKVLRELEIEIQAWSQGNKQTPALDTELQHITDPWVRKPWPHDQILAVPHTGRNRAGTNLG